MVEPLTKRPICTQCKTRELTEEEIKLGKICWMCKADFVIELSRRGIESDFPDPATHGRSDINLADFENMKKQPPKNTPADIAVINPQQDKNVDHKEMKYTDEEKKSLKLNFGIDVDATPQQTNIIVFGSDERTFLKFSMPVEIHPGMKEEIQGMLESALAQIGAILTYGRHFKNLLDQLKNNGN
jgi:hypothetical protein